MTHRTSLALLLGLALLVGFLDLAPQAVGDEPAEGLKVGGLAPTFRLNDHEGTVRDPLRAAAKAKRWVILAFFPKALTPG